MSKTWRLFPLLNSEIRFYFSIGVSAIADPSSSFRCTEFFDEFVAFFLVLQLIFISFWKNSFNRLLENPKSLRIYLRMRKKEKLFISCLNTVVYVGSR